MPKHYLTVEEKRGVEARHLARSLAVFGPTTKVSVIPNAMLAGPCDACVALLDSIFPAHDAPLPPFDGCSHPDQCACSIALYSYESDGETVVADIAKSYR